MKNADRAGIIGRTMALALFAFNVAFFAYVERTMGPAPLLFYLVWGGVWGGILLPLVLVAFSARWQVRFYALFLMCFAVIYALPLSPCEPIVRDLARVRPGMTYAEVRAIMKPYHIKFAHEKSYLSFRHSSDDPAHQGDNADIWFSPDGRVTRTNFNPE